ncbi:MAG: YfcE family phosphodiesterase [Saprospiraceae bacterium]
MLIGVFSDVHDNLKNLEKVLAFYSHNKVKTLIFCGDFCSPIPARMIGAFKNTVHCVFGNGDGDKFSITKLAYTEFPNLIVHGEYAEIEIEGAKIAITHYPLYGKALAGTGNYNAVFSGHTHELHQEYIGECLWLNPGEVLAWKGKGTFATYNTETNTAEIHKID